MHRYRRQLEVRPQVKSILCSLALLFAITLVAQDAVPPYLPDYSETAYAEQQPQPMPAEQQYMPLPDPDDSYIAHPAVAAIVTTDSVTLPGDIGTLRRDELAHSIAQPQNALLSVAWTPGNNAAE